MRCSKCMSRWIKCHPVDPPTVYKFGIQLHRWQASFLAPDRAPLLCTCHLILALFILYPVNVITVLVVTPIYHWPFTIARTQNEIKCIRSSKKMFNALFVIISESDQTFQNRISIRSTHTRRLHWALQAVITCACIVAKTTMTNDVILTLPRIYQINLLESWLEWLMTEEPWYYLKIKMYKRIMFVFNIMITSLYLKYWLLAKKISNSSVHIGSCDIIILDNIFIFKIPINFGHYTLFPWF